MRAHLEGVAPACGSEKASRPGALKRKGPAGVRLRKISHPRGLTGLSVRDGISEDIGRPNDQALGCP
jgi:hypothetical protein